MADEENTALTAVEHMRLMNARQTERQAMAEGSVARLKDVAAAEQVAAENRRGLWADAAVGAYRSVPGAFEEAFDMMATMDENAMAWLNQRLPDYRFGRDPRQPESSDWTFFKLTPEESLQYPLKSLVRPSEAGLEAIKDLAPETERGSGQTIEPIGKFVVGFFTGKKALQGANLLQGGTRAAVAGNAFAAGAISDLTVFDGHEERLSNLIQSSAADGGFPDIANPVTEWLAADGDDGEIEGRIKNVLEGGGAGVLFDVFMRGLKTIKLKRTADEAAEAVKSVEDVTTPLGDLPDTPEPVIKEGEELVVQADEAVPATAIDETLDTPLTSDALRAHVSLAPDQVQALARAAKDGDEAAASAVLKDFNESTFNWQAIESGEDIKNILGATEEIFADVIDEVKGGVQSNRQTKLMAQQVGDNHTAESVARLFRDVRGEQGIAARFYAAQRVQLASAGELRRLATIARETGAPADEARLLHQVQVHAALQAEMKGAQTEIARALQSMSILKESARENFHEFAELKRQFGTNSRNGQQFTKFMDDILDAHSLEDLNARVRWTNWERSKMVFVEYTINSMLSSPKTHAINLMSNVLNSFLYTGDRLLGGAYRALRNGDQAAWREARIDMVSKMTRLDEAWRLARQAWRDGAPVTDKKQRIEFLTRQAISMEGNSWLAQTVNLLGTTIRVPGRALITGDEFFKAVNRNAEIEVLAFRKADESARAIGLEYGSDAYEAAVRADVKDLIDPDNMSLAAREVRGEAIEKSRLVTFQESARTNLGRGAERFVNSNMAFKLVFAPFFRTPMNILRQGLLDRTPLGMIVQANRNAILNGSPTVRAEMVARMTSGVAAMAGAWYMFGTDEDAPLQITGKVPYDSSAKAAGVKDYSMKIGDTWYQFNRLDPLGMWLGLVADFKMHADHNLDEEQSLTFAGAAVASFMNNITNKTWAKSMADIMEMSEGMATNKPATIQRSLARFSAGEFGKLIPQLFKSTSSAFIEDPTASETWSFMDNLSKQLPIFNQDLPRRHDALGREIPLSGGIAAVFNPFATSATRDTALDKELFRLGFTIRPIQKTMGSGSVELNVEEYAKLTGELMRNTGIEAILTTMIEGEGWDNLPDHLKIVVMKERITEARTAARAMLLGDPAVSDRLGQAKANAALLLTSEE